MDLCVFFLFVILCADNKTETAFTSVSFAKIEFGVAALRDLIYEQFVLFCFYSIRREWDKNSKWSSIFRCKSEDIDYAQAIMFI